MTALIKPGPLRLMVYDNTDVKSELKQLKAVLPNDFLDRFGIDLDDIDFEIPVGLTHSWFAGGRLYRMFGAIDDCRGFSNWDDALDWIAYYDDEKRPISQIQIWGHGSPGKSWMKGEPLHRDSVTKGRHELVLRQIADRMTDDGLIWFRNCSVACGEKGREFMKAWANELDVRIAAHTHVIGAFQSGLHSLGPGEEPRWPATEGINEGVPERVISCRNSMPWAVNTIFMLQGHVPENW